jgi:hypothetical protein
MCTRVLFRTVSELEIFHCTGVWVWRPILPFTSASLRPTMKHVNRCEASVGCCKWIHEKNDTREELLDFVREGIASLKEPRDTLRRATGHVLTRVAKCFDVDGGIFENVLY